VATLHQRGVGGGELLQVLAGVGLLPAGGADEGANLEDLDALDVHRLQLGHWPLRGKQKARL
jgi:hypothetical protein